MTDNPESPDPSIPEDDESTPEAWIKARWFVPTGKREQRLWIQQKISKHNIADAYRRTLYMLRLGVAVAVFAKASSGWTIPILDDLLERYRSRRRDD